MNVIGLDSKLNNFPSLFRAFLLDKVATIGSNCAGENGFAALGRPYEMVENQMDAVFISLVLQAASLCFVDYYVDSIL